MTEETINVTDTNESTEEKAGGAGRKAMPVFDKTSATRDGEAVELQKDEKGNLRLCLAPDNFDLQFKGLLRADFCKGKTREVEVNGQKRNVDIGAEAFAEHQVNVHLMIDEKRASELQELRDNLEDIRNPDPKKLAKRTVARKGKGFVEAIQDAKKLGIDLAAQMGISEDQLEKLAETLASNG